MDGETWFWIIVFSYIFWMRGLQGLFDIVTVMWFLFTIVAFVVVKFFLKDLIFAIISYFIKPTIRRRTY